MGCYRVKRYIFLTVAQMPNNEQVIIIYTVYNKTMTDVLTLLHYIQIVKKGLALNIKRYKNSLLKHLLNAVKACIPAIWKKSSPPTIANWLDRPSDIQLMEQLMADLTEQMEKHFEIWTLWFLYRDSGPS